MNNYLSRNREATVHSCPGDLFPLTEGHVSWVVTMRCWLLQISGMPCLCNDYKVKIMLKFKEIIAIRDQSKGMSSQKVLCGGILWDFIAALGIGMRANMPSGSSESVTLHV